jgi:cullin 1
LDLVTSSEKGEIEVKAMEELKADRKLMVEAIIVKIMKSEKMAKRAELLAKTAPLLAQRGFNFNADFVEKSIDRLLDKEFLRDYEDGSLGYIA